MSIQGNRIVDAGGQNVVLRGIHRAFLDDAKSTGGEMSADEIALATHGRPGSWHANVIRIPLGSAQWTGDCPALYTGSATYRANIESLVSSITKLGVVALIDLHTSTAGCTSIDRHAMPDAHISQHFWSQVATQFAGNSLVAFELYNEPHFVSDSVWLSGGQVRDCDPSDASCSAPTYRAVGMQQLYDLVTVRAPGHLVVIDGPGFASNVSSKPVHGSFVYAFHPYTCSVPGAACDTTAQAHANLQLLARWREVAKTQPVLASELGWPSHIGGRYVDGAQYYRETLAYLQRQQWGFVAFAFDGGAKGGFSMVTDTKTYAPNSTTKPLWDLLRGT